MTAAQTRQIVDTLTAWMAGSQLVDDLVPRTAALLAALQSPGRKAQPSQALREMSVDTASMNEKQVYAFYKRIALREDVRFLLAHGSQLPADTRADAEGLLSELEHRASTTADRKRYTVLMDAWRTAENHYERRRQRAAQRLRKAA
jgi:hypothetical protein